MRTLILSDVHANLAALDAVLAHAGAFDSLWVLGDVVGYGPDPNACVERLAALDPEHWLAGNHDWAALGKLDDDEFNPDARAAARWTRSRLTADVRNLLDRAPPRIDLPDGEFTLVHGSPRHPIWEYIVDGGTALASFAEFDSRLCLFGHTHVPIIFEEAVDGVLRRALPIGQSVRPNRTRWLVNPGSVGQPRNDDPRASYLSLDRPSGELTHHRVPYDIAGVQRRMRAEGLPPALATRLEFGW